MPKTIPKDKKEIDWVAIQEEYFQNILNVAELARKYGVTYNAIYLKARRNNWPRRPKEERAKKVKDRLVEESLALGGRATEENREQMIEEAVSQDVADMNMGLRNARLALEMSFIGMESLRPAKSDNGEECEEPEAESVNPIALKSYVDTTKNSVEIIRKIRGLDEKDADDNDGLEVASYDELVAELESLTRRD